MRQKEKKDERREQKLYEELCGLWEQRHYEEIIEAVGELEHEERSNRVWFFMIESYNELQQFKRSFRELERMKECCVSPEDKVKWHYLNSYAMFFSGKQMLAEYNLEKGLALDAENAQLLELQGRIREKEEKATARVKELLGRMDAVLEEMKQKAEKEGTHKGCDGETFSLLLSYPAVMRTVPGIDGCIGMDPLYTCKSEKDADAVKHYLWSAYQALEADELAKKALTEWSTRDDFRYFSNYWRNGEKYKIEGLSEIGEANFGYFERFARLFRDTVGEGGFCANEMSEMANLFRIQFACGMITEEELAGRMRAMAKAVRENFSSWEEFARSLVCGSAYFFYKCSGGNFDEAIAHMEELLGALPYCDWFHYGWYSKDVDEAVKSGRLRIAKRQGGSKKRVSVLEALQTYVEESEEEEAALAGEESCMIAIPASEEELEGFEDSYEVERTFGEKSYQAWVCKKEISVTPSYSQKHGFFKNDLETVKAAKRGLEIRMLFGEGTPGENYLAQLKIIHELMPDAIAVLDVSAEKILSGRWVALAAASEVEPSPNYLFTIQAMPGEWGELWLHTRGLRRFRIPELEIIRSDRTHYNDHGRVMNTLAWRLLEGKLLEKKEAFPLARLSGEKPLLVTLFDSVEAEEAYGELSVTLRKNREMMAEKGCLSILCYPTKEDLEQEKGVLLDVLNEQLQEKPKFWESRSEKERTQALAMERLQYMKSAVGRENNSVLVQAGVWMKRGEKEVTEHLFLVVKELQEDGLIGVLTQDSQYAEELKKGAALKIDERQIEDWCIFIGQNRITPDDVYLLGKRP